MRIPIFITATILLALSAEAPSVLQNIPESYSHTATVQLKGKVQLSTASRVRNIGGGYQSAYSRQSSRGASSSDSNTDSRVLIWLESANNDRKAPRSEPVVLDQKNKRFQPRLIPIIAGETIRIQNSDPIYHNVFSLSETRKFDVGRRPRGDYKDVTFNSPGLVDVFCDIHSDMHAMIVVMPRTTAVWTTRNGSGEFTFQNLEAGSYEINIAALGFDSYSETITIDEDQQTVELSTIRLER